MEISRTNAQYNRNLSAMEQNKNNNTNTGLFETFKNERLKWIENVKEELDEQLENDSERNIKMSDKQWRELMDHVDSAIKNFKKNIKEQKEESENRQKSESGSRDNQS
ncbi:hypothetical protein [Anaerocolumna sp. MB42-C2]|uniref:hypothetical protein n=1 Tax=Anaerocolumna sp. MB42-C2 TaxID=3070997 RepID=UPI0027DF3E1C|nr:hypothetical protein [Anaerocolumna sp. MB42-C2]WMJ90340.1 hypothetical protein RBU59_12650 [Anaerocolumna sp. MB42-C2]